MRGKRPDKSIGILAALTVLLVISVLGAVRAPKAAVALEQPPRCGLEEHVHTEDCYLNDVLVCGRKAHTHTQDCYAVLLRDNDINALLTRVDAAPDKSLETVITEDAALTASAGSGAPAGETASLSAALVFNEGLRMEAPAGDDPSLLSAIQAQAAAARSVGAAPVTDSNTVNFYIRLDGSNTCIGSKPLSSVYSYPVYYYQLSQDAVVSAFTSHVETGLTTASLEDVYSLHYNTTGSTSSFPSRAYTYWTSLRFGYGYNGQAEPRYALLYGSGGSPVDFYTLTLDGSAADIADSARYVEANRTYTLPALSGFHWEDAAGKTVTSVSLTAPAAVYARPDTYTAYYVADGQELFQDSGLQANSLYTLRGVPAPYDRWRSGADTYEGGRQITIGGTMTFTAVRYVTVTFRLLDGSAVTRQVLQGDSVTLLSGSYWTDKTGTSLSGGSAVTVWDDAVFTAVSGPPLTVTYAANWSTPSQLSAPTTAPDVAGPTSVEVAAGGTLAVGTVSTRTVSCPFRQQTNRYGTVYFVGWQTETGEIIQPSARVGYDELGSYDTNGDGTVALTGVWNYHQLQSVNFFVKFDSVNPGTDIGSEHYTDVIFATYVGGLEDAVKRYPTADAINQVYAINLGRSDDYLTYDRQIRRLYGTDTVPWLAEFPEDSYVFEQLKQYAKNGQLSVPNDAGERELVNVNDLNSDSYAIRWYLFNATGDGSCTDWHIDGALVRKEGCARVSKTFAGNATLLEDSREDFYIDAVSENGKKRYIMTTSEVSAPQREAILEELGLSPSQVSDWLTPIDDGDTDANTMLWEFGDMDYGEVWTVTEHPPELEDTVSRAEWSVADASGLNASASGSGRSVTIRGVTQATDLEDPDWPHISFNNIYFHSDSLMLKKEDAATGHALAGAEFQFYQNGRLMTFDFNEATGLYVYNKENAGTVKALACGGYTNVSTTGFSYNEGDITIREVTVPVGYNRVGDVTLGYTADSDGDSVNDSAVGITNGSGAYARYDSGLLVIENSSDPIDVTVTKEWNCMDSERADVVMQLLANGSATTAASILKDSGQSVAVTLTETYGWSHTWNNLPVYASGGPVTWSAREIRIGSENCKADYTFPNWIASYRTKSAGLDQLALVVENTPKRPMLYLEKRDITGRKLLEGAEFTLTAVDENGEPLPGAVVKTAVTGSGGALSFDNLRYNTRYRLVETKAPQDYLPYDEPAYLTIAENGTVNVESHGYVSGAGTAFHIRVLDRAATTLPETGGPGAAVFYASGGALVLLALGGAALRRRKRPL